MCRDLGGCGSSCSGLCGGLPGSVPYQLQPDVTTFATPPNGGGLFLSTGPNTFPYFSPTVPFALYLQNITITPPAGVPITINASNATTEAVQINYTDASTHTVKLVNTNGVVEFGISTFGDTIISSEDAAFFSAPKGTIMAATTGANIPLRVDAPAASNTEGIKIIKPDNSQALIKFENSVSSATAGVDVNGDTVAVTPNFFKATTGLGNIFTTTTTNTNTAIVGNTGGFNHVSIDNPIGEVIIGVDALPVPAGTLQTTLPLNISSQLTAVTSTGGPGLTTTAAGGNYGLQINMGTSDTAIAAFQPGTLDNAFYVSNSNGFTKIGVVSDGKTQLTCEKLILNASEFIKMQVIGFTNGFVVSDSIGNLSIRRDIKPYKLTTKIDTPGLNARFTPHPRCAYYTVTLLGGGGGGGIRSGLASGAGGGGGACMMMDMHGSYSFQYQIGEGGQGGNLGMPTGAQGNSTVAYDFQSGVQGNATGEIRCHGGFGGQSSTHQGGISVFGWGLGGAGGAFNFSVSQGFYGVYPFVSNFNLGGDGDAGFVGYHHPASGGGTFLYPGGSGTGGDGGQNATPGSGRGGGGGSLGNGDGGDGGSGVLIIEQFII